MSLGSAMGGGVAGLGAQATRLAGIADNIANSSTFGYKVNETSFNSIVISDGGSSYSAGGVRANTVRNIRAKGPLLGTPNATDIAIQGNGFLPTTTIADAERGDGQYRMLLARTGSFKPDSSGILRNDAGQVLMGWPADPDGTIPGYPRESTSGLGPIIINPSPDASPTRNIQFGVNLPSELTKLKDSGPASDKASTYDLTYYGNLGTTESIKVTFTPVGPTPAITDNSKPNGTNTWQILMHDEASGKDVARFTVEFGENGKVKKADGTYGTADVVPGTIQRVTADNTGIDPATEYDEETGIAKITVEGGEIDLNLGKPNDKNGYMSQLASPFSPTRVIKDGSPVGILTSVSIDEGGILSASYSTGFVKVLYQVPVVTVPNPDGLTTNSAQTYNTSRESGAFFLWNAGDGPAGKTKGYALESSATDIAGELTNMIQAQRAFSSNAKIIQTVDEMMQETANIKR